jgi:hypothetical protein
MPPKGAIRGVGVGRPQAKGNFAKDTYSWVTNPENRSVVTSLAFFVVWHCLVAYGAA